MSKFKLIKKLPFKESPEIGYISDSEDIYHKWNNISFFPKDYPEFWKEIIGKKNYEVLSIINKTTNEIRNVKDFDIINGAYISISTDSKKFHKRKDDINYILQRFNIHSVERLSDGKIFIIDDFVKHEFNNRDIGQIKKIEIINNDVIIHFYGKYKDDENYHFISNFSVLKKIDFFEHIEKDNDNILNSNKTILQNNKDGIKFDNEKNLVQLLPVISMEKIAQIFTFGAKKYSQWNWSKGIKYSRLYGALLRHLFAWYRGEKIDSESGQSHLYHAGCCIMMLIEMEELRPDMDDRPIHYQDKIKNKE